MSHSNITHGMSHVDTNTEGKPYHGTDWFIPIEKITFYSNLEHADKKIGKEDHPRTQSDKHDQHPSDDKDVVPHHGHETQVYSFPFQ